MAEITHGTQYAYRKHECRCDLCKNWKTEDTRAFNHQSRLRRNKLTESEYWAILAEQSGMCAVCGRDLPAKFDIDHDHATGKLRGFVCHPCNLRLAKLKTQDADWLARAEKYLRR